MAISFTPGQVVEWDDLNAMMAQHGSPAGAKSVEVVPLTKAESDAIFNEGGDPDTVARYRYHFEDGSSVTAVTVPGERNTGAEGPYSGRGQFRIVEYKPSARYTQAQAKAEKEETERKPQGPPGGKPYIDEEGPNGRRLGWDPNAYGPGMGGYTKDLGSSPSAQQAAAGASERTPVQIGGKNLIKVTVKKGADQETHYEDPATGERVEPPTGEAPSESRKPVQIGGKNLIAVTTTAGGKSETYYEDPSTGERVQPPSTGGQLWQDPTSGRWYQITFDASGNPVMKPVSSETVIKPGELPVLQARYGEIASGLAQVAADLNGKLARGEITAVERDRAFTAAHQQAQTAVSELNGILENSRNVWAQQVTQRGQTLVDASGRRQFAGNVLQNALTTGHQLAVSSGPGAGKDIAGGVGAILSIGQRYAQGMGGLPDVPEVPMPAAVQQAQGVGLPGFPMPGAAPAAAPGSAPTAPPADRADAAPRPPTSLPPPIFRPSPPVEGSVAAPQPAATVPTAARAPSPDDMLQVRWPQGSVMPMSRREWEERTDAARAGLTIISDPAASPASGPTGQIPGVSPAAAFMRSQLDQSLGFGGSPVAAGGGGVFDPATEAASMIGDGSDPYWEAAVRRAAAEAQQPVSAFDPSSRLMSGYRRFG